MFFFFVGITLAQNDEAKEEDLLHSGIGVRIHQKVCNLNSDQKIAKKNIPSSLSILTKKKLQDLDYFAPLLYDAIHHLLLWASLPRIEVVC